MLVVDFIAILIAVMLSGAIVGAIVAPPPVWLFDYRAVAAAAILTAAFATLGLYTLPGHGPCERLRLRSLGTAVFAAGLTIVAEATMDGWAAVVLGIVSLTLTLVLGYFGQEALRFSSDQFGTGAVRAAIVGTSEKERNIAQMLLNHPEIGIKPTGFFALPDQSTVGTELPLPLLGRLDGSITVGPAVELGILAIPGCDRTEIEAKLGPLPFEHIATFRDVQAVHVHRLRPGAALGEKRSDHGVEPQQAWSQGHLAIKRAVDLVLTLPIVVLSLPLMLIATALVRIIDPGPTIYVQMRIGRDGRPFGVYKIRTMYRDAEARLEQVLSSDPEAASQWQKHFKLENDPRIIPYIGNILRRFSIDELPQLFNVLKGDMSLVGPRPFPAYHLESFDEEFREVRQSVVPGLTGLWQISSRSDGDLAQQKEQDLLYIRHWSLWLDLQILLQTVPAVIQAKGAR